MYTFSGGFTVGGRPGVLEPPRHQLFINLLYIIYCIQSTLVFNINKTNASEILIIFQHPLVFASKSVKTHSLVISECVEGF